MKDPFVSIIIPLRTMNSYLRENIAACLKNSYQKFEIIVLVDQVTDRTFPKTKVYGTKNMGPAEKRDFGAQKAKGEILCFLDDDAYPSRDWLQIIITHFRDANVAGVGGPGVTPPGVSWQEEASGWASASPVGSGGFLYRFLPVGRVMAVDDFPSMNLAVRKTDFDAVGGFDSSFWPGEDTKLCHDLTHSLGKRIIYDPQAMVYHHRRPLWYPHLRQQGNFGLHRGYFARILPKTSARIVYFLPSFLVALTITMVIIWVMHILNLEQFSFLDTIRLVSTVAFLGYIGIVGGNAFWVLVQSRKIIQGVVSIPAIILTHYWYGIRFVQGFVFTKSLKV